MKNHPRIEKSVFRKGEYVGYCHGAQRIRRQGGLWVSCGLASTQGNALYFEAKTLAGIGSILDTIAAESDKAQAKMIG